MIGSDCVGVDESAVGIVLRDAEVDDVLDDWESMVDVDEVLLWEVGVVMLRVV